MAAMLVLGLMAAITNGTNFAPIGIVLPFFIREWLHLDATWLGAAETALAVGGIAGAVTFGRMKQPRRRGLLFYGGAMVMALCLIMMGVLNAPVGLIVGMFAYGGALTVAGIAWTHSMQEIVPPEKLGRVMSLDQFASFAMLPAAFALAGSLAGQVIPPFMFIGCGIFSWLNRRIKEVKME